MARRNPYHSPHPPRVERRSVTLNPGGVRIAVVSDTHSRPHPATLDCVAAETPDLILHGGDIGELSVLDGFAQIAPLVAVRGNIDGRDQTPPDFVELSLYRGDAKLKLLLTHIALRGPKLLSAVRRRAEVFGAQVVICGHSHVPLLNRDQGLVVFNPGSCGPRRFTLPILYGVMDFGPDGLSFRHMDCETGLRWQPPPPPRLNR